MARKLKLSWTGNQQAQSECDAAWAKVQDGIRKKKKEKVLKKQEELRLKRAKKSCYKKRPTFFTKETYQQYLNTKHWRKVRLRKLNSVGWICERCDSKENLQVHHNHYKTLWHETNDDLTVYCGECHQFAHGHFIIPWI